MSTSLRLTWKKKPKTNRKGNDPIKVAANMAKRAKEFASRALSSTVKIFKTANKKAIVPVTNSSDDALSLNSIVPIFESNKKPTRSNKRAKKGGKSRRKRTLKRGGTCSSRQ